MGLIKGFLVVRDNTSEFEISTNFPVGQRNNIVIAVDPEQLTNVMKLAWGRKVYQYRWKNRNKDHDLCFVLPDIPSGKLCVTTKTEEWKSDSDDSVSLYPWWVSMPWLGMDFICQIQPEGCSSEHYHAPENGFAVAETYWPIMTDGLTTLKINEEPPKPLTAKRDVLPYERHQLIREGSGFSIHLLVMYCRKYRFPDKRGHCYSQPCRSCR